MRRSCKAWHFSARNKEKTLTTAKLQRILLVDDESDLRTLAKLALESLGGFTLELCESGEEALGKATAFAPDLILLDVSLPGMDGPETLRALRQESTLASVPVVFMSGRAHETEVKQYKAAGAVEVIGKPFEILQLADRLRDIWLRHQAMDRQPPASLSSDAHEIPAAASSPVAAAGQPPATISPGVQEATQPGGKELAAAGERPAPVLSSGVQEQLRNLRKSYMQKLPDKISRAETLWQEWCRHPADWQTLREVDILIHQLSGSGATFGAPALSVAARQMEAFLHNLLHNKIEAGTTHQDQMRKYAQTLRQMCSYALAQLDKNEPASPDVASPLAQAYQGAVILVVEDDEHVAQHITLHLTQAGYQTRTLCNPLELQQVVQETPPTAVIMDILFPQANGTQIIAEIQQQRDVPLPVIFISGRADLATRLQAVRAGGYAYFSKPIDMDGLLGQLAILTGQNTAAAYRIMVVDDDRELAAYHALILRQHNMVTEIVNDPMQVLDVLPQFRPDLILLDLNMPDCNGLELATVIRQQKDYTTIPIVFLTAEKNPERYVEAMLVGANDFLHKPIEATHLVLAITNHLHRMHTIYQAEEQKAKKVEEAKNELAVKVRDLQQQIDTRHPLYSGGELAVGATLPGSEGEVYTIERALGRGGMGVTYLAMRRSSHTSVVLKTLLPSAMSDVKVLMRFVQEARMLLTLYHENLVRGYDFYQSRDFCYLAMEFIAGQSIDEMLEQSPRLQPLGATRLVLGVARALAYLEEQGLIHRDIKPANIIVNRHGVPKLVDFGIAKMTNRDCSLTTQGIILGTPYYLSPEQAYGTNSDIRSDIYSLGATYYHMVVGTYPFTGDTMMEVLQKRFQQTPKPCLANPHLPQAIGRLIEKMMHLKKERRQQHAKELIGEIEKMITEITADGSLV
jgi:DNA-binding response OmpR family regulator